MECNATHLRDYKLKCLLLSKLKNSLLSNPNRIYSQVELQELKPLIQKINELGWIFGTIPTHSIKLTFTFSTFLL